MKLVKVRVNEGFATIEDGSFGPGECEIPLAIAEKYACFVTILPGDKKPVRMAAMPARKDATPKKRVHRKKK